MEQLNIEIKLFISTKGLFNSYIINYCLKSRLLTPLMPFATLTLAVLNNLFYYGPYKQDNTSTKRRLVLGQNQCIGYGTDKTSRTIGRGVAKSHNYIYTEYTYIFIYLRIKYTDILIYLTFTIKEFVYLKTAVLTFRQFSFL